MNRFSRINTIWRKELVDTLRDRRTLIAMVVVPIVLYPALMLGSLQAFEYQATRLQQSEFLVAVENAEVAQWLRDRLATDISRHEEAADVPAEQLADLEDQMRDMPAEDLVPDDQIVGSDQDVDEAAARARPYQYRITIVEDVRDFVKRGLAQVGVLLTDGPLPEYGQEGTSHITLVYDQTDFRSSTYAAPGLEGMFQRLTQVLVDTRLKVHGLDTSILEPLVLTTDSVATPERVGGSILGQIVPLILIVMTITGAIYPAIDLTAGERERGTLETLMVAPVPTVDLIAGKFVVVTLIGLLSASLNLLSVGGTVYFGGLGEILTKGGNVVFPLYAMPWVLVVLVPLAVMFSAVLLAVCSFARSFKEAQNYIMPVMIAALIPAVVGSLPGTRLEGPMLVVPVANVVVLTRDLFVGRIEIYNILWVTVSSTIYAAAAVAAAAKLFGQEAVLFADSSSIKSLFVRRFFKKRSVATASQALLLLSVIYLLHFVLSQTLLNPMQFESGAKYLLLFSVVLTVLLAGMPLAVCAYTRVRAGSAFGLELPRMGGMVAALCLGLSTWILAPVWFWFQQRWMTIPPEMMKGYADLETLFAGAPIWLMIFAMAVVPGFLEEFFFRGYVLRGLRGGLGMAAAIIISALAFAMFHHSIHRLVITGVLGLMFGLLVVRSGSVWPAIVAHTLHNGLSVASAKLEPLRALLVRVGWPEDLEALPPRGYVIAAAAITLLGLIICFLIPAPPPPRRAAGDFPETPLAEAEG